MITKIKLKEYVEYRGYYDGFYLQKIRNGTNLTSDHEWHLIARLVEDIRLVMKGLVSKEYSDKLSTRLRENCDSEDTIRQLEGIAAEQWSS